MQTEKWRYYNHAAIPTVAPNKTPDCTLIENGNVWEMEGAPLLARWTTDFDCGFETNWWYVIKDEPFDIDALKAKRRYEINKGIKNFDVKIINPCEYKEELFRVRVAAFSAYPEKYRPTVDKDGFINGIENWAKFTVFGAFFRETNELTGYALLIKENESFLNFSVLKTNPAFEKYSVNAALVQKMLDNYTEFLSCGGIICDGARSISHETNFQNYLEKYFGFRKAYCHLHIRYNPKIKWLIEPLFLLRKVLLALDGIGIVHSVNGVLKMEEIRRSEIPGK